MENFNRSHRSWVKRLGQWHLYIEGREVTLCGMPMLGNDYTEAIPVEQRTKCKGCWEEANA